METPAELARLAERVRDLIEARDWQGLRSAVEQMPAPDIADLLLEVEKPERVLLFRALPRDLAADAFSYLDDPSRDALLHELTDVETRHLLANLTPDDRTELLSELPGEVTRRLLNLLSPEDLGEARSLLGYPEDSVGRLMTPDYVAVRPQWTVEHALAHIRKFGRDSETLNVLYVTERGGRLVGHVDLRRLVLAAPQSTLQFVMDESVHSIAADQDREAAVRMVERYDLSVLPVVGTDGVLLGIVTVDDILDVAEEEATEDIQKLGGMAALDAPYLQVGVGAMIRKRGVWLAVLFFGEMLTATAMARYEEEIARAVVLALFIPLIISSGGNSGSQAASLIIRSLALDQVRLRDWWRVFRREVLSGLALGALLGAIGFFRVVGWHRLGLVDYGQHHVLLGLTLAGTLVGVVLFGTLAGSMLPLLMRRLGFDPAVSSAPFVATLVDVTGIVLYFAIAHVLLRGAML